MVPVYGESKAKVHVCMSGSVLSALLTVVDVLLHLLYKIIRLGVKVQIGGLHHL